MALQQEFQKDRNWSKDKMQELSELLDMEIHQIYKWNWQEKKKIIEGSQSNVLAELQNQSYSPLKKRI